ncbi:siderophore-interacting protein [Gordonia jinhuaensis]|uniref:Siderophore-interacting protein n=1 Tax=Gordonia jinhuaensis TaxID=1517702 RepID=A0A916WZ50_9ACTN|nr:siderophore-interacting protein [Gordonia jinhuaensis]GGB42039.1 putative siderophore-interacting protein [Gordonia jinhuaensis]
MSAPQVHRGWQGAVLKVLRANDFTVTVTGPAELVSENYLRLPMSGGGLLTEVGVHPTMWVRLWIPTDDGKPHQRGYTLVDPDPATDTFAFEFAVHDGPAVRWAQSAAVGDTIGATMLGSKFEMPSPAPAGWLMIGDLASLPAINSLLDAIGPVPARIWLEHTSESDTTVPVRRRPGDEVVWVARTGAGAALVEAVSSAAPPIGDHSAFVACDTVTTRAVTKVLKERFSLSRKAIKAQGYWTATH